MTITARFSSLCPNCQTRIAEGTKVVWEKGQKAQHLQCPDIRVAPQPKPVVKQAVVDGYYTLVREDGTHRTLRIHTDPNGWAAGKTVVSLLTGSDNESDYTSFAFVRGTTVCLWRRHATRTEWLELATALVTGDLRAARIAYARQSGRCARCNRRLTHPESLQSGLGPDCEGRR